MRKLTLGVLGGMGPEATVYFFSNLVAFDKVEKDQDHLHIIIENNPSIPDRTRHLLFNEENPIPAMLSSLRLLEQAQADVAAIPCMTAHAFLSTLRTQVKIPILSAFEIMAEKIPILFPGLRKLGILATTGSRELRLYESHLPAFECLWPDQEIQEGMVMEAVYGKEGIKAGNSGSYPRNLLVTASRNLANKGAEAIIAGCTEVPLVLRQSDLDMPLIDPMTLMAEYMVEYARNHGFIT